MQQSNRGGPPVARDGRPLRDQDEPKKFHRVCRIFSFPVVDTPDSKASLSLQHRWQKLEKWGSGQSILVQNTVTFVLWMRNRVAGQPGLKSWFDERLFISPKHALALADMFRRQDVYEYLTWLVETSEPNEFTVPLDEYIREDDEEVLVTD